MSVTLKALSADELLSYLNSLIDADRAAVQALIEQRVPCGAALEAHPYAVPTAHGAGLLFGVLGLVNGLAGMLGRRLRAVYSLPASEPMEMVLDRFQYETEEG